MPSEAELAVVGWFHRRRAERKQRPDPIAERLLALCIARVQRDEAERRHLAAELEALERAADLHEFERSWG